MTIYSVLNALDPRLTWPGMLVLILMAVAGAGLRFLPPRGGAWLRPATRLATIALGILAAAQIGLALSYFFYPRYLDWIEATVVSAAWIGWRGGHFYPLLDGGDIAGIWYGPLLYQVTGFLLWLFGPSIGASKILGVTVFIAAQYVSFRVLRRIGADRPEALAITFVQCLLQSVFANQGSAFGVRTDPLLLLGAELSVWAAISSPSLANAAVLGALIGLSMNLKVQAAAFSFPIFAFFISRPDSNTRRAQLVAVAALAGLAALALPFAAPSAAPARYIHLFSLTKHHAMSRWVFEKNIVYLAALWSPIVWLIAAFRPKLPQGLLWFGAACIPAMAAVTTAASIEGGGPYNYIAFLPSLAWAFVRLLQIVRQQGHSDAGAQRLRLACLGIALSFLVGLAPAIAIAWEPILHQYADAPRVRGALAEIDLQMKDNPGRTLEVGPGPLHDLRVIPVFRGSPLPIDAESWAEMSTGGISEAVVRKTIAACRVDYWLTPAGGPLFSDGYDPRRYTAEFLAEFHRHYRKEASGRIFDRWGCIHKD